MSERLLVTLLDQSAKSKGYGYGSEYAEAYRHLRTNIEFSSFNQDTKVFSIVSAYPSEGKSTVASNLAVVMAGHYQRVLLIDCDLRKPVVHKLFHASNRNGISNLLMEHNFEPANITKYFQQVLHPNITNELFIITAGPSVPNPSEMVSSKKFLALIQKLRETFDIIIMDGPPVLPVPDSIPIGLAADGTLFIIANEKTNRDSAKIAITQLKRSQVNVLGTVLTMMQDDEKSYKYSYYNDDRNEDKKPIKKSFKFFKKK